MGSLISFQRSPPRSLISFQHSPPRSPKPQPKELGSEDHDSDDRLPTTSIGYTPIYSDTRTGLRDLPHLHLSMYSTKGLWSQRCDGKIRGRELVPAILVKFLFVDSDLHPLNARCCLRVTSPIFHTLVYTKMKT